MTFSQVSYTRVGTLEFVHQSSGSSSQVLQQQQRINCLLPPLDHFDESLVGPTVVDQIFVL